MSWQAATYVTKHSRHKGSALLTLLMIANHAHPDGTHAFPSQETLARETRMSVRQVRRIVDVLSASGEIRVDERLGGVSEYTIVGVPANDAPTPDKMTAPLVTPDILTARADVRPTPDIAVSSTPDIAVSAEPSLRPSSEPSASSLRSEARPRAHAREDGAAPPRSVRAEERAQVERVWELWCAERKRRGLSRYTDPKAKQAFRVRLAEALRGGEWRDVEMAIRSKASDPKASPWYLDEWTRYERALREEAEAAERQARERDEGFRAVFDRAWSVEEDEHPGLDRAAIAALHGWKSTRNINVRQHASGPRTLRGAIARTLDQLGAPAPEAVAS